MHQRQGYKIERINELDGSINEEEFVYSSETGSLKFSVEINGSREEYRNDIICKYYSLTEYNIDALINNYLYASHPRQLNDPFDCYSEFLNFTNLQVELVEKKVLFGNPINPSIIDNKPNLDRLITNGIDDLFMKRMGVISLTESDCIQSMWGHYNGNKGYAINFRLDILKTHPSLSGPFEIRYNMVNKLPIELKNTDAGGQLLFRNLIKDECWRTEKEWRMFGIGEDMSLHYYKNADTEEQINNRRFYYNFEAVQSITLGFFFFLDDKIEKINDLEFLVRINSNNKNKLFLLQYVSRKQIHLKHIVLNNTPFGFKAQLMKYEFNPEINTFKYKLLLPNNEDSI